MNCARIASLVAETATELIDDRTLADQLGLDVARVQELSRGRTRGTAADGDGPAALAHRVALRALAQAGCGAREVELIVFATTTPDITFPGSACLLQAALDIHGSACLDVRSQCTGFLTALDVASRFICTGMYRKVLVAAADVPTHVNRYDGVAPELTILTGDGAAAALVEGGDGSGSVLSCITRIDGSRYRDFWCEFPASRHLGRDGVARGERAPRSAFEQGGFFPRANFAALRETALERVPPILAEALLKAGVDCADVVIVAHVDPSVEDALEQLVSVHTSHVVKRSVAYSFGSTLPLALAEAGRLGEVEPGQIVGLVTSGAGASWGAAILRW